ncbi:UDP-N-acetylmuramoyl-L-alanine--D-glutamate ligase [Croceibacterium sp. TMG7-5b_MA50]|uniref:UDP-N-acetylmuramoyl-L-alanine--D-glutamate ligase n=1 Tax=Croceibacterium sp. TMG7-5b_MA50 TaxID=3121290 RepID=UPI0032217C8D
MITSPAFAGRRYAVLGLARSGMATVDALLASGAHVTAWDRRDGPREALAGRCDLADPLEIDLAGFDGVVVSPGVPLNTHPIRAKAAAAGVPVNGDIELFALARADLPPHKVVGITGTNGKSTTTALIHHICRTAGVPTTMGGNIGLPILAQEPLPAGGVYVLELSSYQIDLTYSLDCDVAVLLNITPDHLDRYDGFDAYRLSKLRLFALQSDRHAAIIADADEGLAAHVFDLPSGPGALSLPPDEPNFGVHDQADFATLQGPHNAQNIWAAATAAQYLGISAEALGQALRTYPGLPHRMERVGEYAGVLFVNDSKATNPASTAPALAAYPRIHWICGGLPKTDNLDECAPGFGHVVRAYTIGEAGPLFADLLEPHMPVERCEMLCEAVRRAIACARPGEVVLFSPACASFDQFRDYEKRGEAFRQIVRSLSGDGDEDDTCCEGRAA